MKYTHKENTVKNANTECEFYDTFYGVKGRLDGRPYCHKKHFLLAQGDCKKCKYGRQLQDNNRQSLENEVENVTNNT